MAGACTAPSYGNNRHSLRLPRRDFYLNKNLPGREWQWRPLLSSARVMNAVEYPVERAAAQTMGASTARRRQPLLA